MTNEYKISFSWDGEAKVWLATSEDIRGLVLEDESFDGLLREVNLAVPTLVGLNKNTTDDITLDFIAHRQERLACVG